MASFRILSCFFQKASFALLEPVILYSDDFSPVGLHPMEIYIDTAYIKRYDRNAHLQGSQMLPS